MKRNKKKPRRILTAHRRQMTLERVRERGVVKTSELSQAFAVSAMTVRNDLNALAEQGSLVRIHGGAMAKGWLTNEPSYQEKTALQLEEKRAIGTKAAQLIKQGMAVFIGNGTTTMHTVHTLVKHPPGRFRAFTNALNHAMELTQVPDAEVYVLGGYLRGVSYALVGSLARGALSGIYFDLALLGANGVSAQYGVTIPSLEEAETVAEVVQRARRTVLLADHSKFGVVTHGKVAALHDVTTLVTDDRLSEDHVRTAQQMGVEVVLAPPQPSTNRNS